jgi:hypothetical protein
MSHNWNRQARKSGGYPPDRILITEQSDQPVLSIQCFEDRHNECDGDLKPFFPGNCQCKCHHAAAVKGKPHGRDFTHSS